jgi:hypothetical protein
MTSVAGSRADTDQEKAARRTMRRAADDYQHIAVPPMPNEA